VEENAMTAAVQLIRATGALAAGGIALAVGALTAIAPATALVLVGGVIAAFLLASRRRIASVFLASLAVVLLGYMFLGRGFAYVGKPPFFIGELALVLALLAGLAFANARHLRFLQLVLLAYIALGIAHTLPYLEPYGKDALRDGALWGYALIAVGVSLALRPGHLERIVGLYRKVVPIFVLWVPVAAVLYFLFSGLPRWPSDVPVLVFKGGDMAVHLAGAAGFVLLGLYAGRRNPRFPESLFWPVWLFGAAIVAAMNRGGLLAMAFALFAVLLARPSRRWLRLGFALAALVVVLAFLNPKATLGEGREVSFRQLGLSSTSIFTDVRGPQRGLEATKQWRLDWWSEIASYTFQGPYFWSGKGFGVNLANDDGFQVFADESLRAPHNTHFTVLARMGVPGFVVWIVLLLGFATALLRALWRARRAKATRWVQLNAWLLVLWLAMTVNTSFDPYLEGPQGAIWFWSVFGVGLAALRIQGGSLKWPREPA
jgi:hypothetical protein